MSFKIFLPLFIALACLPFQLQAASTPSECSQIADRSTRLNCFDDFFPVAANVPATAVAVAPVEARSIAEYVSLQDWFAITAHRSNYILPATRNFSADYASFGSFGDLFSDTEVKLQFSFKTLLVPGMWKGSSLWLAYSQQSYWQLYAKKAASAPFRETNHEPELIWSMPLQGNFLGMNLRTGSLALHHMSNGQSDPLSRSWNRLTGEVTLERGRFVASVKSWVRLDGPENDNNPFIEDYMGRIQLGGAYKWDDHTLAVNLKNNLDGRNRSGLDVSWTFPLAEHLKGYFQVYTGYGENLIDMQNYTNRIGLGIALTDWY